MDQPVNPSHPFILPTSNKSSRRKASAQLHLHLPNVPSIANIAAAFRASVSSYSIKSLAEEPTRTCHPTKLYQGFKVPTFLDTSNFSEEFLEWINPSSSPLPTSGRLISSFDSPSTFQLVHDNFEKTLVAEKEDCYIHFQVLDASLKSVQQRCDIFYVLYTDEHSYASSPWHSLDKPTKNECFIIPYSDKLRIVMVLRFPVSENRRKLFSNFKKKTLPDQLNGSDIPIADVTLDLVPMDFGKETKKINLTILPKLTPVLDKTLNIAAPEFTIQFGIWTGATVRIQNEKEASYTDYLTVTVNLNQPVMKRYWGSIHVPSLTLHLYDFEAKESKLLRTLPFDTVTEINTEMNEETFLDHSFLLHFCQSSPTDLGSSQDTLIPNVINKWRCSADDETSFQNWVRAMKKAIDLAQRRSRELNRKKDRDVV